MGLFSDVAGIAAGAAGISVRKAKVKKAVEEYRQRAQEEMPKHEAAFQENLARERENYFARKEHYIVTYMFTQVMLGSTMGRRDFTFLDQMPEEYRKGKEFLANLKKVETEYYSFLAEAFKDGEITVPSMIRTLKDLLYFGEIREEVQQIIAAEPSLQDEMTASASVFTGCDDVDGLLQTIRDFNMIDCGPTLEAFSNGVDAFEQGDYKGAVTYWLYGTYSNEDFDKIKLGLLHFAQDENQDVGAVELYDVYQKTCRRLFGISKVKTVEGTEKVVLYPSVDMVIAEELRHIHSGTADQYDETLKDWLDNCGTRVDRDQLDVLQNVFFHLGAFGQERIILEYMVKNNMPRTADQEQRLKFLKGTGAVGGGAGSSVEFSALNVQAKEDEFLYDHRFFHWKANEIQQYFNTMSLNRRKQEFPMVMDEWQKDVSIPGIRWDGERVQALISGELDRNFGDTYDVSILQAGAAVEDWVDVLPTIYVHAKDSSVRNGELSFLVSGEQITNSTIHLTTMTLLAPTDSSGRTMENEALCKKVIAVKEKHNPRVDTFISTMKNILVAQLESWINQFTNSQEIY